MRHPAVLSGTFLCFFALVVLASGASADIPGPTDSRLESRRWNVLP
jgi:hypothetical protein